MSSLLAHHSHHPRLQRAAILAAILVAATLAVFVLNSTGLPSRAAASVVRPLAASSDSTSSAVAAVPSDRALILAAAGERAAQAKAAQVRAAQAATAAAAASAARQAAARAAALRATEASTTLNVWTAGFQAQINACRGGVDVTAHYGTATVAEHWGCGGSSLPTSAGAIIHLTGLDAGTYRVTGVVAVLNAYTAHTNQIPRGYQLLLQTCRDNDSHTTEFIGLQRVG
jgi:hypothetical protein